MFNLLSVRDLKINSENTTFSIGLQNNGATVMNGRPVANKPFLGLNTELCRKPFSCRPSISEE